MLLSASAKVLVSLPKSTLELLVSVTAPMTAAPGGIASASTTGSELARSPKAINVTAHPPVDLDA
jgi:hypothetical protein